MALPPPPNPFELLPSSDPWKPAARRGMTLFGAPVELCWLPKRKERSGQPGRDRPPFRPGVAERILREETLWRASGVALTPNKFPFARGHAILWAESHVREAPVGLLETAFGMVREHGGTALGNCIGSAASVQRSHVHLVEERLPFLNELPNTPSAYSELLPRSLDVDLFEITGVPYVCVGLRGSVEHRAAAAHRLLELRTTATFNVIADYETTWLFPRGRETPAPHFPYPLGAAELWGRWCYGDEEPFRQATSTDLERALDVAGVQAPG